MTTLADLLSSRVKIDGQEPRVREMARRSGLAEATARQELRRLSRPWAIEARKDGNRTCYRANECRGPSPPAGAVQSGDCH